MQSGWQEAAQLRIPLKTLFSEHQRNVDNALDANGFPVNSDYGNAFIKISTANNTLSVADYFTMHNTTSESDADQDLGSGGEILLPDLKDAANNTWHLAVGAGKDSIIYVVNRDLMGKFNTSNDNAIYQEISSNGISGGSFATPAYFNNTVYYGTVRIPESVRDCKRQTGDATRLKKRRQLLGIPAPRRVSPRMELRMELFGRWKITAQRACFTRMTQRTLQPSCTTAARPQWPRHLQ